MDFATKTTEVGRRAANILELDLDGCANSYGIAPCNATLALTNLLNWSQEFDQVTVGLVEGWQGGAFTTANAVNAPDGTLTADSLSRAVATPQEVITQQNVDAAVAPLGLNSDQSLTFFVRPIDATDGSRFVELNFASSGTQSCFAYFDIIDGLVVGGGDYALTNFRSAGIQPAINVDPRFTESGWYRIKLNFNSGTFPGTPQVGIRLTDSTFPPLGASSGAIGSGVYIWGAQRRSGLFPGKYQVTVGAPIDGMGAVNDLCFNTFGTCQDTPNYVKEVRTQRFIDRLNRPAVAMGYYPSIETISYGPTRLEPGGGLAFRGKVTVTLQDFTTNDSGIDDYFRERSYDALTQGTFFGKLKRRNRFYIGRPMRVLEGYIDEPFDLANFRAREFIIESINGPDKTGRVTIVGKDPLSLARNDRAKAPVASVGASTLAMTVGVGTVTVGAGEGAAYDVDPHIRIDDEIMLIVSRAVDVLTVTRAQGGTVAQTHDIGAAVQSCYTHDDTPVIDIIQDLLQNFANIPASFIPFTDWETEEAASLTGYNLTTIISEPTGVQKLLKEIVEITLLDIWYSDVDQEIKLKLQTPFTAVTQMLDDNDNVLADSLIVKDDNNRRLTRVLIYYGIRNFARDLTETENYSLVNFEIEADKEGANKFADQKITTIFSRWMDSSNAVQIQLTSQRLLERFGNMPIEVTFNLDAKDVTTLETGDVYDLNSRIIQGIDGLPETTRLQVIETKPMRAASTYQYRSLAFFTDPTTNAIVIAANETDYDLFVELGGPPGPVDVTVTVNAGVFVRGSNGNPAFKTDGMHPDSTIVLNNNGHIHGHGGNGGKGGDANIFYEDEGAGCFFVGSAQGGAPGQSGGTALHITVAEITIDNTLGDIFGGAGGGGGGDGFRAAATSIVYGGGGGGGGLGEDTALGGAGGDASINPGSFGACGPDTEIDGTAGGGGTDVANGAGGAGGGGIRNGGDGGADWGLPGAAADVAGGGGGNAGFAVDLNGATIIWLGGNTAAKVKGTVA